MINQEIHRTIDIEIIPKVGIEATQIIEIKNIKRIDHEIIQTTDQIIEYRSKTPKHQRQINQVKTIEETNSDPPGIDVTESTELQLNYINCESTDSESDTENTISVNMIVIENDYKTLKYEQPFHSHVYENQLELLLDCYNRPRSNTIPIEQEVNEAKTLHESEKEQVPCSSTSHIYQNVPKEPPIEKKWTILFLLESPKVKHFNHQTLK